MNWWDSGPQNGHSPLGLIFFPSTTNLYPKKLSFTKFTSMVTCFIWKDQYLRIGYTILIWHKSYGGIRSPDLCVYHKVVIGSCILDLFHNCTIRQCATIENITYPIYPTSVLWIIPSSQLLLSTVPFWSRIWTQLWDWMLYWWLLSLRPGPLTP